MFNAKLLLSKNKFAQFKIFTISIIFENSCTSQKLKIEKKSKKTITTKIAKIKTTKIKTRDKKIAREKTQKQVKKKYIVSLNRSENNQILNNVVINSKNINLFELSKLSNFTKLINSTKLIIRNITNCFFRKVVNNKKKL